METYLYMWQVAILKFFSYSDQGGQLLMQEWWFKCCDFKLDWRKHHFSSSDPWAMNISLFVRGCITPHYSPASWLMSPCCDVRYEACDGQLCLCGATGHGWWPGPIDIWYHSFHSQHSHMMNGSNPQLSPHPLMTTQDNGPWWNMSIEAVSFCSLSL